MKGKKQKRKIHIGSDVYEYIIGFWNIPIWKNGVKIKVIRVVDGEYQNLSYLGGETKQREYNDRREITAIWPSDIKAYIIKNGL